MRPWKSIGIFPLGPVVAVISMLVASRYNGQNAHLHNSRAGRKRKPSIYCISLKAFGADGKRIFHTRSSSPIDRNSRMRSGGKNQGKSNLLTRWFITLRLYICCCYFYCCLNKSSNLLIKRSLTSGLIEHGAAQMLRIHFGPCLWPFSVLLSGDPSSMILY